MSVYTAVPVHEPPVYEQRTLTLPSKNLSQPEQEVTPLRYLGSGDAPLPTTPTPQPQPLAEQLSSPQQQAALVSAASAPTATATVVPSATPTVVQGFPVVEARPEPPNPEDTVFFPVSASLVDEHYIPRLKHLAPDHCYLVIGHSDPTGSKPLILGLSIERAAAVATVMRTAGLRVYVEGVGSYGASHKQEDYPKDRRAEVWHQPCPGLSAPTNPTPPPKLDLGGISVQVIQADNGQWQTVVTRRFDSKADAQAWATQMQKLPPMRASLGGISPVYDAQLGYVGTVALGLRAMATRLQADVVVSSTLTQLESALNRTVDMLSVALTAGARQWLATSPVASFSHWREAVTSIGSPTGMLPTAKISAPTSTP